MSQKRSQIFVSYTHADSNHLQRLKVHLRPFERQSLVDVWSDTRIRGGEKWKIEIKNALERAAVAILLISADYLASDFVADNELPSLLEAAKSEGVRILPIILKPCAFTSLENLSQFQAVNDPAKPMIALDEALREGYWSNLAITAQEAITEFEKQSANVEDRSESATIPFFEASKWATHLVSEEISNPAVFSEYHVYTYEHIDVLEYMPSAEAVLQGTPNADNILTAARQKLKDAGWEGDGELKILWIPPFVGAGMEDTWGVATWFVKQSNNGTSFIMSPVPLPFARLLEQQPPRFF